MSRGNSLRGEAQFTFEWPDDHKRNPGLVRDYHLVLDNQAWVEAEEVLGGVSILDVVDDLRAALEAGRNPRLKHMAALVYGGLAPRHPEITEADVIDMFMSGDEGFRDAVLQAIQGAQPPNAPDTVKSAAGKARKTRSKGGTGS